MLMQRTLQTGALNWENLGFWDRAELYDKWYFLGFAGNILLIFGSTFYLFSNYVTFFESEMLIGFGSFFIWIKALKFFQGIHPYDLFLRTLIIAAPNLIKVIIGVAPFIIGCGFLAQMLFWKSREMFGFYFKSQWYVFALQTGDGIFDVFNQTIAASYIFGYLFTFIYTFLIISTVMSIFMVIVEDAYVSAKYS